MGKIQLEPKKGVKTFTGFDYEFPKQLAGIVPAKEYINAIELINYNGDRDYRSYIWGVIGYAIVGLIILIIFAIVELIRWSAFKKTLRKDLDKVIENINRVMINRQVSFSYKMSWSAKVTLIIQYPDSTPNKVDLNQIVQLDGGLGNGILIQPFTTPIVIENPRVSIVDNVHPIDKNFKNVMVFENVFNGATHMGWSKVYDHKFYNYISNEEYQAMIQDFNTTTHREFESPSYKFFIYSCYLCIILIGIITIFPAMIWFMMDSAKYNKALHEDIDQLLVKYNSMYNPRGLSIVKYCPLAKSANVPLNFIIPFDVGQAPTLTQFKDSNELVLEPSIPNGILPYFRAMQFPQPVIMSPQPVPLQPFHV